ncbi:MAG: division/cell wall cluster transcriptional repressor MraZ, partial [Pirellulaceae bacterium]|nr:division/cell wall cluster transcriptional repressor MraZ [Pirellulaceae bacterium]
MLGSQEFLLGEFQRTMDERFRLSIPSELGDLLAADSPDC